MDLVMGALGMLPSKLLELLKEEYKLQKGLAAKVQTLSLELEYMHPTLRKVAAVPWYQLDEQVKIWAREVREASYDIEDILDSFLVRVEGHDQADLSILEGAIKKIGGLFRMGKARREISCAIEDITKKLREITERRARYKIDDLVAKPAATTSIDPRLSALYYTNVSQIIGIEEPRDEVIKMLTSVGEDVETKIVSILGFGGLGKTTLAEAVYENLTEDVDFKAFVSVGQNPDLKKVLKDILIGLDECHYTKEINITIFDERQLVKELRKFLKHKRYFIVIDDIWDVPSWGIIRYALYDNTLGSKIVITTRKHDVAMKVGRSYNMKPLSYPISKQLFYGRVFGSEEKCPENFKEISEEIIEKCGGVPLAIITTSSLLANKPRNMEEWYEFCKSIGSGLGRNPDIENMRKILSLSYYDLPAYLKTCLLYLSIFPEDYEIDCGQLIWRWTAEGFLSPGEGGQCLFEVGVSYFYELVNRSLIHLAKGDHDGFLLTCRVHDMVLDMICSISRDENFVATILGGDKQNAPSWGLTVHRLSLQNATLPTIDMSKLRSLTIFSDSIINLMPSLSCHNHLRVLELEGCRLGDHQNLSFVGSLFHLRYLGLRNTRYAGELPSEMGKLQFLQTLDIFGCNIKELPSSIVGLRQLMCLHSNWILCLPNGFWNLTSLQVLWCAIVDSVHTVEELGRLTQLRVLTVRVKLKKEARCDHDGICKALVESLGKLQKIRHLVVLAEEGMVMNLEGSLKSLGNLSYLRICETTLIPKWIDPGSLLLLSSLDITVARVRREDIQALGKLQALWFLKLTVSGYNNEIQVMERFMVAQDAFPYARVCGFYGFLMVPSMFPPGAMPRLQQVCFSMGPMDFFEREFTSDDDLALDHLSSLQKMLVVLHRGIEWIEVDWAWKMEEKLQRHAGGHSNHPFIDFMYSVPR